MTITMLLATTWVVGHEVRGQSNEKPSGPNGEYPTMLDMTFPEFEAAVKKTDIVLLPTGSSSLGLALLNKTARALSCRASTGPLLEE
jgi:hypothetical protein